MISILLETKESGGRIIAYREYPTFEEAMKSMFLPFHVNSSTSLQKFMNRFGDSKLRYLFGMKENRSADECLFVRAVVYHAGKPHMVFIEPSGSKHDPFKLTWINEDTDYSTTLEWMDLSFPAINKMSYFALERPLFRTNAESLVRDEPVLKQRTDLPDCEQFLMISTIDGQPNKCNLRQLYGHLDRTLDVPYFEEAHLRMTLVTACKPVPDEPVTIGGKIWMYTSESVEDLGRRNKDILKGIAHSDTWININDLNPNRIKVRFVK